LKTTRRRILQQLAAWLGAVSVTAPGHAASPMRDWDSDPALMATIDALISNKRSAAIIGQAYLHRFDHERSTAALASMLRENVMRLDRALSAAAVLRQVRLDFERGDVVNLHGWILSRTEGRICALCARLQEQP
jgi:hypothetical protein